jgi:signal transduction histidine kinase
VTEDEQSGRGLTGAAFVLALVALAAAAGSTFGREFLPDPLAEGLDADGLRISLAALAVVLLLVAFERGRRLRRLSSVVLLERHRAAALDRRLHEVNSLAEASRWLSGPLDEEEMLDAVVRSACDQFACARAALLLADPDRPILRTRATMGFGDGKGPPDVPLGNGFVGQVAEAQEPARSADGRWAAVPLVAGGELIGVLWVEREELSEDDLRILVLFAELAAQAIANARVLTHERLSVSRLAELDRLKSDFVAMITHELKTPLTSLLGYGTILRKRADTLPREQREEFFAIMARQGERILRLIDELLQSSRIESAERLPREHVDMARILRDIGEELATARGRRVEVDAPDADLGVYGDPVSMEHVVTNLLDNALKYSPEDTPVRARIEEIESEVRVLVANEGEGIPADELPHIFERYRRARGAEAERGSVGLGLFIARNLVEAHGGRIWVESEPGRGATFIFALPRRREDAGRPGAHDAGEIRLGTSQGPEEPGPVLDEIPDLLEEAPGLGAVEDPVVERER